MKIVKNEEWKENKMNDHERESDHERIRMKTNDNWREEKWLDIWWLDELINW